MDQWPVVHAYSSLSNNCADGINVQAGKFSKINNCADCNKCAGWKISISYQICRLENLQNLLILQDGITIQGGKFVIFLKNPGRNICQTCKIPKLTLYLHGIVGEFKISLCAGSIFFFIKEMSRSGC